MAKLYLWSSTKTAKIVIALMAINWAIIAG
jgi:hypothetical protein